MMRTSLACLGTVAVLVCATSASAAEGSEAMKKSMEDFLKVLEGVKKEISAEMKPAALAQALTRWATANEAMAKSMQSFADKNPALVGSKETPPELVEVLARLEKGRNDFAPTSRTVRSLIEKHKADRDVQAAVAKLKASLGSVENVPE